MTPILLTGFEPYGGHSLNPAYEVMKALDGCSVAGAAVIGRALPVAMARLKPALEHLFADVAPAAVISLGLQPGAAAIHIERIGVNVAHFDIPDNDGASLRDGKVTADGPPARLATLPVRAIEEALLSAGIPARVSESAGTYLCNACLYAVAEACEARPGTLSGFLHLPYMPEQVAELALKAQRGQPEYRQAAGMASMELTRTTAAVEIAIAETVAALGGNQPLSSPGTRSCQQA